MNLHFYEKVLKNIDRLKSDIGKLDFYFFTILILVLAPQVIIFIMTFYTMYGLTYLVSNLFGSISNKIHN